MTLTVHRAGAGKPLLLVHGLGSSWKSWQLIVPALAADREVIAVDLPGHGATPAGADSGTFEGQVRSLDAFLEEQKLVGVDMVGSSMGGRMVLELARRGRAGTVVSLDPGGFWQGWERDYVRTSLGASIGLLRMIKPSLPALAANPASRAALLAQLSARPWALDARLVADELNAFASSTVAVSLTLNLTEGPMQQGPAAPSARPLVIGWGRSDRLLFPTQAARAVAAFPSASLHWFEGSGHFPMWDQPEETLRVIREAVA
ncbi:MAG TPA: alpha/beta fold hydrolase [Sphingomonadaceae bacterium]|nr:alpha/beta fold hydrolase [Sphingomonadaceae bacterium]